jgi:hypothetical protein
MDRDLVKCLRYAEQNMSDFPTSRAGHAARGPTLPHALVGFAEDAVAIGDMETAIRFIAVVYQVFDEALDAPPFKMAA